MIINVPITHCMKKFFSILVASMLTFSGVPSTYAEASVFSDVAEESIFFTPLSYLKAKGVITGYDDGTFKPEKTVNRAEALKMLIGGFNKPLKENQGSFPDVQRDAWFSPYVSTALAAGYVNGYPDGKFRPENTLNKAEALKILHTIGDLVPSYTTVDPTIPAQEWYAPFLLSSYDKQLIDAGSPSSYALVGNMTRGEIATILYRILYMKEKGLAAFPLFDEGRVSYYSDSLVGNNTSSGERYTHDVFTAAHKTLPFGTFIQVISPDIQKSVLVRVNDRGPFSDDAVTDLSRVAFETLFPTSKGVFNGRVLTAGSSSEKLEKRYLPSDTFPGMTLDAKTPNMFRTGEFYVFKGSVPIPNQPMQVEIKYPNGEVVEYEYTTQGTVVGVPLYFKDEGIYNVSVTARGLGTKYVPMYVTKGIEGRSIINIEPYSTNIQIGDDGDSVKVAWEKKQDINQFRLVWTENGVKQEMYVNNQTQLNIARQLFTINPLKAKLAIYGGVSSTTFSHDVYTNWVYLGETMLGNGGSTPQTAEKPLDEEVAYILKAMNTDRARYGIAPLELYGTLSDIAQAKAVDMATNNYFSHENLAGEYVNDWKGKFGFAPLITENIAYTSQDIASAYTLFQNSPRHFDNIIDPTFTVSGIGIARSGNVVYVVQEFSTKPLAQTSISDVKGDIISSLSGNGMTMQLNQPLDSVAQEWSNYIAQSGQLSFYIGTNRVTDVVRKNAGISNVDVSVFSTDSMEKIKKNIGERVKNRSGTVEVGIGISQSESGLIRATLIIKAG